MSNPTYRNTPSLKIAECALRYRHLQKALIKSKGDMGTAAKILGVSKATAYRIRSDGKQLVVSG